MPRCILGPNLEILSWIGGEWWQGQAQNMAIFYCEVKFDLEVQGQLPPKTIGILNKVFCSCCPNLVILVWTRDKLSREQASAYRTHRQTDAANDNTRRPKLASGKNRYVKTLCIIFHIRRNKWLVSNSILTWSVYQHCNEVGLSVSSNLSRNQWKILCLKCTYWPTIAWARWLN